MPLPLDGLLDLHTFQPRDAAAVLEAYLEECRRAGILRVRVVHGKGIGQLREIVHRQLARLSFVAGWRLASGPLGGWGATLVDLHPLDSPGGPVSRRAQPGAETPTGREGSATATG